MDHLELKKNRLDLEYHGESQKINAYLILLTTGVLGFLGTFLWIAHTDLFYFGISLTLLVALIGLFLYLKSEARMKHILEEIESLS